MQNLCKIGICVNKDVNRLITNTYTKYEPAFGSLLGKNFTNLLEFTSQFK